MTIAKYRVHAPSIGPPWRNRVLTLAAASRAG